MTVQVYRLKIEGTILWFNIDQIFPANFSSQLFIDIYQYQMLLFV